MSIWRPSFSLRRRRARTGIEFLGVDFDGNIYAGEVSRRRLVRYVPHRPSELNRTQ